MQISFHNTHAYPGCLATITGHEAATETVGEPVTAQVEFSDGGRSTARVIADKDDRLGVAVAPYRTARGTEIATKYWDLVPLSDGRWKVAVKGRPA